MTPNPFAKVQLVSRPRSAALGTITVIALFVGAPAGLRPEAAESAATFEAIVGKIAERRYHDARQLARSALEAAPDGSRAAELKSLIGAAYRAEGDPESAIGMFEEVLEGGARSGAADVCESLARCHLDTGDVGALRALLEGDGACAPVRSDWQRELLGVAGFGDGQLVEARQLLESIGSRGELAWHYLGRLNFQDGKYEGALLCFEAALKASTPDARYENQIYLAWCLLHLNRIEKARTLLESVASRFKTPEPYYLLGQVELRAGNAESAASSFRQALARQPGMAEAQFGLAGALRRLGQPEKSKVAFDRFRVLHEEEQESNRRAHRLGQYFLADPGATRALELCRHYLESGDLESALTYAWIAVRSDGGSETRIWLARVLVRTGRFQGAAVHYRRVIMNGSTPSRVRLSAESELRDLVDAHAKRTEAPSSPK
jgi:tetratricopeptide (TPR) repeat protein